MEQKEYSIITTYECNWSCPYCVRDSHGKHRTIEDVLDATHKIEPNSEVSLSGGEPGTLTTDELLKIMSILKLKGCTITICSNGEIFKHKSVVEMSDFVLYHCSVNMELDDIVIKGITDTVVKYTVIVTDNNIDNLDSFLMKHKDIYIFITPGLKGNSRCREGESLGHRNIIKLIRLYKNYITEENLELLLSFGTCGCDDIFI